MGVYHLMGLGRSPGAITYRSHRYQPRSLWRLPRPAGDEVALHSHNHIC